MPAMKTPAAAPRPALTPIQYQAPIAGQRNGGGQFSVQGLDMSPDRPLLVFFTSRRSGPARRMESLLAHIARKERDTLVVKKVDVDERPDLVEKFRVSQVPALALVRGKRVVARLEGRATAPKIESMIAGASAKPAAAR
jgi:thioredoxin 1